MGVCATLNIVSVKLNVPYLYYLVAVYSAANVRQPCEVGISVISVLSGSVEVTARDLISARKPGSISGHLRTSYGILC